MPNKAFNKAFSHNLNRFMEKYHLNQKELAEKLGISPTSVSFWCNGLKSPRMDKVDKLCEIFHCRRSDLVEGYSSDPSAPNLTLSPDEEKHIRNYRALDEADRIKVDGYMDGILDGEKYKRGRSGIA